MKPKRTILFQKSVLLFCSICLDHGTIDDMRFLPGYSVGLLFVGVPLLFSPACGSDVTGSGGTGGGAGGSSSVGGDPISPVQACNDHCHKLETLNCNFGGNCMTQCDAYLKNLPPECQDEASALFTCGVLNTTSCSELTECAVQEKEVKTCIATFGCTPDSTCFGGMGMNGESLCGCDATCKGTKYSTDCTTPAGGGASTCDCLVDDQSVGTCQSTNLGGCGPKDTCCNTEYFKL